MNYFPAGKVNSKYLLIVICRMSHQSRLDEIFLANYIFSPGGYTPSFLLKYFIRLLAALPLLRNWGPSTFLVPVCQAVSAISSLSDKMLQIYIIKRLVDAINNVFIVQTASQEIVYSYYLQLTLSEKIIIIQ